MKRIMGHVYAWNDDHQRNEEEEWMDRYDQDHHHRHDGYGMSMSMLMDVYAILRYYHQYHYDHSIDSIHYYHPIDSHHHLYSPLSLPLRCPSTVELHPFVLHPLDSTTVRTEINRYIQREEIQVYMHIHI